MHKTPYLILRKKREKDREGYFITKNPIRGKTGKRRKRIPGK